MQNQGRRQSRVTSTSPNPPPTQGEANSSPLLRYHVPQHVQEHIDYITPGIKLMPPRGKSEARDANIPVEKRSFMNSQGARTKPVDRLRARPTKPKISPAPKAVPSGIADCGTEIIPDCIKALYNITDPTTAIAGNSLGIFECTDW